MNLFDSLAHAIAQQFPGLDAADFAFAPPPKQNMGDVAMRTFEAARKLEMAPPQLAQQIVAKGGFGPAIKEAKVAGPYVNFYLDRGYFARQIVDGILTAGNRYGSSATGAGLKALVEQYPDSMQFW